MDFMLKGQIVRLTRSEVERRLREVRPGRVQWHAVEVNGGFYPVKQALRASLEVKAPHGFTSQAARRIFRKLGFRLFAQVWPPKRKKSR